MPLEWSIIGSGPDSHGPTQTREELGMLFTLTSISIPLPHLRLSHHAQEELGMLFTLTSISIPFAHLQLSHHAQEELGMHFTLTFISIPLPHQSFL